MNDYVQQLVNMDWPAHGVDLTRAFGKQVPQTTPLGSNVVTFEPIQDRARGGARPMLAPYILPRLPNGAHLIQHLNYVVDPDATALLADFGNGNLQNDPGVTDPSTNPPGSNPADPTDNRVRNRGNTWRTGGSGLQPNRHVKIVINNPVSGTVTANPTTVPNDGTTPSLITVNVIDRYNFPVANDSVQISTSPSGRVGDGFVGSTDGFGNVTLDVTDTTQETVTYSAKDTTKNVTIGSASVNFGKQIQFVQTATSFTSNATTPTTFSFTPADPVTSGNLLVLAVMTSRFRDTSSVPANSTTVTVSDTLGNAWTMISPYVRYNTSSGGSVQDSPFAITLWTAIANSTGSATITVTATTPGNDSQFDAIKTAARFIEFTNNAASPLVGLVSGTGNGTSLTTGTINVSGGGQAVLGYFYYAASSSSFTPGGTFQALGVSFGVSQGAAYTEYVLNQSASLAATATVPAGPNDNHYAFIGASFTP